MSRPKFKKGDLDWNQILAKLGEANIKTLFVEGGANLLNSIYDSGIWDESRVFISPALLNGGISVNPPKDALIHQELMIGRDKLVQSFKKR